MIDRYIDVISDQILNPVIGIMFAVALVVFFWGIIKFIANTDNEEERRKGIQHMIWGVVGMFIMVSVWGIMNLIQDTVGSSGNPDSEIQRLVN